MLQGFYWDSYEETSWSSLVNQADELSKSFNLIWLPQSGYCNSDGTQMGYTPVYYFNHNSSFGSEQQLRLLIRTLKEKGTGTIADVVVNHRANLGENGSWVDYPAETYNGVTYQMTSRDICRNDDGGGTKWWADQYGYQLSDNDDTGEDWSGCRDLDHNSGNVKWCVKAYLDFLLNDLGYAGFRYDMVKGFSASFVGEYNDAVHPAFSVGEHFSSSWEIGNWIWATRWNSTEPQSCAFDFQFRYRVRDAINNNDWRHLYYDEKPLAWNADNRRYAVTFVENHDTERRKDSQQDPIWRDTIAANAYLLAMPGTPCVFWRHWAACKEDIKRMIEIRRMADIRSTSECTEKWRAWDYFAVEVKGNKHTLICVVGSNPDGYKPSTTDYTLVLSGKGFRYYLSRGSSPQLWADVPSGRYTEAQNVKVVAVTNRANPTLVYTTDGSTPTVNSTKISSGDIIPITSDCKLRVGMIVNNVVTGIIERDYQIQPFTAYKATIYVQVPSSWQSLNAYVWDKNGKALNGNWPGNAMSTRKRINGSVWYYKAFDIKEPNGHINMEFSTSSGSRLAMKVTGVTGDRYYKITTQSFGSKFLIEDLTEEMETGVEDITAPETPASQSMWDLSGKPVTQPSRGQIYVKDGKKYLKK
ncbi:MAG: starch-binding protein [Bacteroidaceae bacterium]|nr:starch-binding protein [Bacteroidaceae bacterium]